jgi:hypothetical protein
MKYIKVSLIVFLVYFSSCSLDRNNILDVYEFQGMWETSGSSVGKTFLAVGNIPGEPNNRVYMCQWTGVGNLYKGTLSGDIITWDKGYGMPNAKLVIKDVTNFSKNLELKFPSQSTSLTLYKTHTWSTACP